MVLVLRIAKGLLVLVVMVLKALQHVLYKAAPRPCPPGSAAPHDSFSCAFCRMG